MKILLLLAASVALAADPKTEMLYPEGTPGAVGQEDLDKPALTIYLADPRKPAGAGVVVCPGGGYGSLAMLHEGSQVAEYFNNLGISAFVLKYRLGPRYRHPAPLQDVQRAIRYVRSRSTDFKIESNKIGVMGFSAGGHLAATAATHFDPGNRTADAQVDRHSSRPDFAILAYPVISLTTEYTHKGSRRNLLGDPADQKLAELLSNEKQVTAQTPPTFLFHTDGDTAVPPENSVLFYLALRKAGVPAEMHIYEKGRHGVGLAPFDPVLQSWPGRLADWLRIRGILPPK